jgi:heavy metal sensor kinase
MKRFKTLRMRFALWVALLLLAVLTFFGAFVYSSLARSLSSAVDDLLRLSASQAIAAVNIENGQINFSDSIPEGTAAADLVEHGLTIRILDLKGNVLQAFGPYRAAKVEPSALTAANAGQTTFGTMIDPQEGDSVRFYTAPIIENNQLVGVVQVAQDLGNVTDTLDRLLVTLLLASPLLVALAGLGGYFLAARALSPIDSMTRTTKRISAENLSARLNFPNTDDEVGRLAATFDDMLARLDDSFHRERQFTADASHELRTPLAAMQAILSVIRQERRTSEDYEQALDDLAEETNRLRALTEDLLQLARGDLRKSAVRETIDLSALLLNVSDSLRPLAEAKGLRLDCTIPEGITLTGDSDGLIRLFVNLLDNAIKFTEKGGITMAASQENNGKLQVTVVDTGCGIAAEHLPHIFNRFYRVDRARTGGGIGLGLAIALEITRSHGGTIDVSSEQDHGTMIVVTLHDPMSTANELLD